MKLVIEVPENLYLFVCENGILALDILNSEERDTLANAIQTGEVITINNQAHLRPDDYDSNGDIKVDGVPTVDLWKMRQEATENALKKAEVLYKRPQGEWQPDMDSFYCDQCGVTALEINRKWYKSNFCPNCGAEMKGNTKQ